MSELLKYLQSCILKNWYIDELNNITCLLNPNRTISLIPKGKFKEAFPHEKAEKHFYDCDHFKELSETLDKLKIGVFEIDKQESKPLLLKTEHFDISIAPKVNIGEDEF